MRQMSAALLVNEAMTGTTYVLVNDRDISLIRYCNVLMLGIIMVHLVVHCGVDLVNSSTRLVLNFFFCSNCVSPHDQ